MNQMIMDLPVIALRGLSILPNMIVHFEVSRNKSKRAIEAAMLKDQNIFLLTNKRFIPFIFICFKGFCQPLKTSVNKQIVRAF
mgnify:CR=1 FL=1